MGHFQIDLFPGKRRRPSGQPGTQMAIDLVVILDVLHRKFDHFEFSLSDGHLQWRPYFLVVFAQVLQYPAIFLQHSA